MEDSYLCRYKDCGKLYSTKYSLQRHYSIRHSKSKRFTCKQCKKILSSNQNLTEHMYTHSNEKPLSCTFPGCSKVFRQSSQLSNHKKVHKYLMESLNYRSSVVYLKVRDKQLTDLLKTNQGFCETGDEESSECFEMMSIPKIFTAKHLDF